MRRRSSVRWIHSMGSESHAGSQISNKIEIEIGIKLIQPAGHCRYTLTFKDEQSFFTTNKAAMGRTNEAGLLVSNFRRSSGPRVITYARGYSVSYGHRSGG